MFRSDTNPASLRRGSHDKHQQVPANKAFPLSLALIPAGLEVVPSNDKHVQQTEKETAQAWPEVISQDGKEVSNVWAAPHDVVAPPPEPRAERKMCGLKPRLLWTIIASSVVALALIVGLAAGLGLKKSRTSSSCDPAIRSTAISIVNLLKSGVSGVVEGEDDAKRRYTIAMVRQLRLANPDKNVIVYRNPASVVHFDKNAVHCRTDLDLGLGFEEKYETYVFEYGEFALVGQGGYENWSFDGNYTHKDNHVVFNGISLPGDQSIAAAPNQPAVPPSSPARLDTKNVDGNYFVNCSASGGRISSGMAYYAQLDPGQNVGHHPNDYVDIDNSSYVDWAQPGAVTFPNTSITVQWAVFGGSDVHAINTTVGTANNGYEYFWVFRDAGGVLYQVDDWTCCPVFWAY